MKKGDEVYGINYMFGYIDKVVIVYLGPVDGFHNAMVRRAGAGKEIDEQYPINTDNLYETQEAAERAFFAAKLKKPTLGNPILVMRHNGVDRKPK